MSNVVKMNAELKEQNGKGAARALRRAAKVPAILYGGGHKELMLSFELNEFLKEYNKGNIQSRLFEINLNGKIITAIPRAVQVNPLTDIPVHADFQEVSKDTIIKVAVHIKVINEDKAPGIKRGGVLNITSRTILVNCHPTNIPLHINVDVGTLEIGRNLHINDITLPEGVVPVDKTNFALASVSGRAAEVVETAVAAPTADAAATPGAPAASTPS